MLLREQKFTPEPRLWLLSGPIKGLVELYYNRKHVGGRLDEFHSIGRFNVSLEDGFCNFLDKVPPFMASDSDSNLFIRPINGEGPSVSMLEGSAILMVGFQTYLSLKDLGWTHHEVACELAGQGYQGTPRNTDDDPVMQYVQDDLQKWCYRAHVGLIEDRATIDVCGAQVVVRIPESVKAFRRIYNSSEAYVRFPGLIRASEELTA